MDGYNVLIWLFNSIAEGEIIYSGIAFHEFYDYLKPRFENMILLKESIWEVNMCIILVI
jgi:hypothetical protein